MVEGREMKFQPAEHDVPPMLTAGARLGSCFATVVPLNRCVFRGSSFGLSPQKVLASLLHC